MDVSSLFQEKIDLLLGGNKDDAYLFKYDQLIWSGNVEMLAKKAQTSNYRMNAFWGSNVHHGDYS